MLTYKVLGSRWLLRSDGVSVPVDPNNGDYKAYLDWVAGGGQAAPADPPSNAAVAVAVQAWLDSTAVQFQYSDIVSAISYAGSGVDLWNRQGTAFRAWRDAVWTALFALQASIAAGTAQQPATIDALIASLPQPTIPQT